MEAALETKTTLTPKKNAIKDALLLVRRLFLFLFMLFYLSCFFSLPFTFHALHLAVLGCSV